VRDDVPVVDVQHVWALDRRVHEPLLRIERVCDAEALQRTGKLSVSDGAAAAAEALRAQHRSGLSGAPARGQSLGGDALRAQGRARAGSAGELATAARHVAGDRYVSVELPGEAAAARGPQDADAARAALSVDAGPCARTALADHAGATAGAGEQSAAATA